MFNLVVREVGDSEKLYNDILSAIMKSNFINDKSYKGLIDYLSYANKVLNVQFTDECITVVYSWARNYQRVLYLRKNGYVVLMKTKHCKSDIKIMKDGFPIVNGTVAKIDYNSFQIDEVPHYLM